MTNSGDREIHNSETRQQSYTDSQGNTHTHLTRTDETVNNPSHIHNYRDGYANGREAERNYQQNLAARDNENASAGLLLGIFLTSLVGLIVGAFWYFNQPREAVVNETQPVVTTSPSSELPTPQPQQTTIIERTREVPVVVPQPQAPQVNIPPAPDINVNIPSQQPTTSGTQTTPQRDSSANTPAAGDNANTNTPQTTVPQGSDKTNEKSTSTTDDSGSNQSNPQ